MKETSLCHGGDRPASFSVFLPVYVDTTPKMALVDGKMELVQGGKFHVNVSDIEQFIEQHYMRPEGNCRRAACVSEKLRFTISHVNVQTPEPNSQADVREAEG